MFHNKHEDMVKAGKKFIQAMHLKAGALHKQLGVPMGKNIPAGKLRAAAKKSGKLGKRARLAITLKKLPRAKGPRA